MPRSANGKLFHVDQILKLFFKKKLVYRQAIIAILSTLLETELPAKPQGRSSGIR